MTDENRTTTTGGGFWVGFLCGYSSAFIGAIIGMVVWHVG